MSRRVSGTVPESREDFESLVAKTEDVVEANKWTAFSSDPLSKVFVREYPVFYATWVEPIAEAARRSRYAVSAVANPTRKTKFGSGKDSWLYNLPSVSIDGQRVRDWEGWESLPRTYTTAVQEAGLVSRAESKNLEEKQEEKKAITTVVTTTTTATPTGTRTVRSVTSSSRGGSGGTVSGSGRKKSTSAVDLLASAVTNEAEEILRLRRDVARLQSMIDDQDKTHGDEVRELKREMAVLQEKRSSELRRLGACSNQVEAKTRTTEVLRYDLDDVSRALEQCRATSEEEKSRCSSGRSGGGGTTRTSRTSRTKENDKEQSYVKRTTTTVTRTNGNGGSNKQESSLILNPSGTAIEASIDAGGIHVLNRPLSLEAADNAYDRLILRENTTHTTRIPTAPPLSESDFPPLKRMPSIRANSTIMESIRGIRNDVKLRPVSAATTRKPSVISSTDVWEPSELLVYILKKRREQLKEEEDLVRDTFDEEDEDEEKK